MYGALIPSAKYTLHRLCSHESTTRSLPSHIANRLITTSNTIVCLAKNSHKEICEFATQTSASPFKIDCNILTEFYSCGSVHRKSALCE